MKKTILLTFVLLLLNQLTNAQLCVGSLGDPIINRTFGTISGPLNSGITNLSYTNSSCPNDGQYTITNFTSGCFSNTWVSVPKDHTGDAGGQFMLINASVTPNDFYVDTVSGLCSNTTFEFASWVLNMLRPSACGGAGSKPNLTFRIETTTGVVLLRYDTGDIPATGNAVWNQYGTFFKTPVGINTIVLRITNNAPGGCGNDLAIDDITFRPCGPPISITSGNQLISQVSVCENKQTAMPLTASFNSGSFISPVIQWQKSIDTGQTWSDIPGAQSFTYVRQPTNSGLYQYRAVIAESANFASLQCRVFSNITSITVLSSPILTPKTLRGCTGNYLTFQTIGGAGYSYQWTGPNNFSSTSQSTTFTQANFSDSGQYTVVFVSPDGCVNSDTFHITIFPGVKAGVSPDTLICEGITIGLQAIGGNIYKWTPSTGLSNPNISNPLASPTDSTTYQVLVSNQYACKDSAKITINVNKAPIVNAGADKTIFEGQSIGLDGNIYGNYSSFYWLPNIYLSNGNSLSPQASPTDSITYTLFVVPNFGCPLVSDQVFIKLYKHLNIPNAFSPNGDGINDYWVIKGLYSYPGAIVRVFSRDGAMVFQSHSADASWDGKYKGMPLPVGAYFYVIDLNIGIPSVSGVVIIIR